MTMFIFNTFLLYLRVFIAGIGVIVIMAGTVRSIGQLFKALVTRDFNPNYIRLQFGNSVILGLEFMVGGDIVASLVEPDYYNLGLLAIIVLIRTVLSFFLNRELKVLSPEERQAFK